MTRPELSRVLTTALTAPVSIEFESGDAARAFRADLYRQRDGLRLVGINDYDCLKFKITRNVLTIVASRITIRDMV